MKLSSTHLSFLAATLLCPMAAAAGCGSFFTYCDGPLNPCPCGNVGVAGNGCANSANALGAQLVASGCADHVTANDTVLLSGSGMPPISACAYFQGINAIITPFGDGVRCVDGQIIRLAVKINAGGASAYPTGSDPKVSVKGLITAPGVYHYQVWYRDAVNFCTPATYNLTNAVEITWD